jgi:hypothetical protein
MRADTLAAAASLAARRLGESWRVPVPSDEDFIDGQSTARVVRETRPQRWALATLLASLMSRVPDPENDHLWHAIESLVSGEAADVDSNDAGWFFRLVPDDYRQSARTLLLGGGLASGHPRAKSLSFRLGITTPDNEDHAWARSAVSLIDSVEMDELPKVSRMVTNIQGAGPRDEMRAAISRRYGRLGHGREALSEVGHITAAEPKRRALAELAVTLSEQDLPAWVDTVLTQAGASLLAAASPRWSGLSEETRKALFATWLLRPPRERRNDVALEVASLSGLLLELDGSAQRVIELLECDFSLSSLLGTPLRSPE